MISRNQFGRRGGVASAWPSGTPSVRQGLAGSADGGRGGGGSGGLSPDLVRGSSIGGAPLPRRRDLQDASSWRPLGARSPGLRRPATNVTLVPPVPSSGGGARWPARGRRAMANV